MRFLITGGTGLIGSKLVQKLLEKNHKITVLSRKPSTSVRILLSTSVLPINSLTSISSNTYFDVIINLSGEPIMEKRWTNAYKKALLDSRIGVTQELVNLVKKMQVKPKCFISASAIGFYGTSNSISSIHETDRCGDGFISSLCARWEQKAQSMRDLGVPTSIIRIPPVLSASGGIIQKLLPWYSLNLGCVLGTGKQLFPWVYIDDLVDAIQFIYNSKNNDEVYNVVAPEITDNKTFSKLFAKRLKRRVFLRMPALLLKLLLGDATEILTNGQKISSDKLISAGFNFKYNTLNEALQDMFKK
jgi:uncharacterized protein (TIGR01777 family)